MLYGSYISSFLPPTPTPKAGYPAVLLNTLLLSLVPKYTTARQEAGTAGSQSAARSQKSVIALEV